VIKWQPIRDVDDMFDRFMADTMRFRPRLAEAEGRLREWTPVADISETGTEFLIKAELPEVRKEDVSITVQDGMLTISGERKLEKSTDDEKLHRTERVYGSFSRGFGLPENIDEKAIRAESKDGVIVIHLPKLTVEEPQARQIEIS
jgi:HSP20 family protein